MRRNQKKGACMCSELVTAHWTDAFGQRHQAIVNLEEIWPQGAILQFEYPMRLGTGVEVLCGSTRFEGAVVESRSDFVGDLVEIQFTGGCSWSRDVYEPDHFFDPGSMSAVDELRAKNNRLLDDVMQMIRNRVA